MNDNARFDNTTSIYLINLPWKLGLGLGLDLRSCCTNLTYSQKIKKTSTLFREFHGKYIMLN